MDTTKFISFFFIIVAFSAKSFSQEFNAVGSSVAVGDKCYRITPDAAWSKGAAWSAEMIDLTQPFQLEFTVTFQNKPSGADGLVFAFQQMGTDAIGVDGGSLGFQGISPSLGVEFDIYRNADLGDPAFDHIAVMRNGSVNHNGPDNLFAPVSAMAFPNIKNGNSYVVQIAWNPANFTFAVRFDCVPKVFMYIDLVNDVFNGNPNVYWGFTGSTGGQSAEIIVCLDFIRDFELPSEILACPNEPVILQANTGDVWQHEWTPSEFLNDASLPNPTATVEQTTTFTVLADNGCGQTIAQEVTVVIDGDIPVDLGPDLELCEGASADLILPEGPEYTWSTGETGPSITLSNPGTYWVTAQTFGCIGRDTIIINPGPGIEELILDITGATCGLNDGSITVLAVMGSEVPFTYRLDDVSQSDPTFSNLNPGIYSISVTGGDDCTYATTVEVADGSLTKAGFTADPLEGTAPLTVSIENLAENASDIIYLVNGAVVSGITESLNLEEAGTYEIMQLAWQNDPVCADTAIVFVVVDALVKITVPNVVTPNNDGANDQFRIESVGIKSVSLEIFNRWGRPVFELKDKALDDNFHNLWDPSPYEDGVYHYLLRYTDINGKFATMEGNITVVR